MNLVCKKCTYILQARKLLTRAYRVVDDFVAKAEQRGKSQDLPTIHYNFFFSYSGEKLRQTLAHHYMFHFRWKNPSLLDKGFLAFIEKC